MDSIPLPKSLEHLLEKRSGVNRRKQERRKSESSRYDGAERRKDSRRQSVRRKKS